MNLMIEIFPEIESFFQQAQFSQEDLDILKEAIEESYKDEHSRKLAISAINIKLLHYQLSGPLVARVNEKIKRTRIKHRTKKAASSLPKKKLSNKARKTKGRRSKYSKKVEEIMKKYQDVPNESKRRVLRPRKKNLKDSDLPETKLESTSMEDSVTKSSELKRKRGKKGVNKATRKWIKKSAKPGY